jgi:DNA adenine methylase
LRCQGFYQGEVLKQNSQKKLLLHPFLKWAGGKRWFVDHHSELLPKKITGNYVEPFLGGGAVFFSLQPEKSILADASDDLINTYKVLRDHVEDLVCELEKHSGLHSKDYYYDIRSRVFDDHVKRAARFLYLNRTCFNGIYRVNLRGEFNVPIGSKDKVFLESDDFYGWSNALKKSDILNSDFESIIDITVADDFLFVDPPYTVRHNNNGFVKYNEVLFSWKDQVRLHDCLVRAKNRGVRILMTNANHESLRDLYSDGFKQHIVSRFSGIAASKDRRSVYEELVIQSQP